MALAGSRENPRCRAEVSNVEERVFVEHGVQVVFSGHDHVYERIKPQNGIHYFVVGWSAAPSRRQRT
jgi:hypothetical protein